MNSSDRKIAMTAIDRWKRAELDKIGGPYHRSPNWRKAPAEIRAIRRQVTIGQRKIRKWENTGKKAHNRRVADIERRAERLRLEVAFGDPKKVLRVLDGK